VRQHPPDGVRGQGAGPAGVVLDLRQLGRVNVAGGQQVGAQLLDAGAGVLEVPAGEQAADTNPGQGEDGGGDQKCGDPPYVRTAPSRRRPGSSGRRSNRLSSQDNAAISPLAASCTGLANTPGKSSTEPTPATEAASTSSCGENSAATREPSGCPGTAA
jgi:hypothetical protein